MIEKKVMETADFFRCTYSAENGAMQYQKFCYNTPPQMIWHLHDCYEIMLLLEGDVTYLVEGNSYHLKPYDIIFTNMHEIHVPVFGETVYNRRNITIHPSYFSAFITNEFHPFRIFNHRKPGENNLIDGEIVKKHGLDKLYFEMENYLEEGAHILAKLTLMLLLTKASKISNFSAPDSSANAKVSEIIKYIDDHLAEDLSYNGICKALYINPNYLYHFFKNETGMALSQYIGAKRIIKAKELLKSGMPSLQTAEAVGYNDYSNFYRTFKNITGKSPKEFLEFDAE